MKLNYKTLFLSLLYINLLFIGCKIDRCNRDKNHQYEEYLTEEEEELNDEITFEKIKLEEGEICVIHSEECMNCSTLRKQPKIFFKKEPHYVYDCCLDRYDADILNSISIKNISKELHQVELDHKLLNDSDSSYLKCEVSFLREMYDCSPRRYHVYFAKGDSSKFHKLNTPLYTYDYFYWDSLNDINRDIEGESIKERCKKKSFWEPSNIKLLQYNSNIDSISIW